MELNPLNIFLFMCTISKFDINVSCEEMLALPFKLITEIPGDVENIQHLPNYLAINTDNYTEERKLELCQIGLTRVNLESGNYFILEDGKPGNMKVYVLIVPKDFEKSNKDKQPVVEQVYQCPTNPSTYISAHLDEKTREPVFGVFYKQTVPLPKEKLSDYHMKLVEDIFETTVDNLYVEPRMNIVYSEYDADRLSEKERHKICTRAMQIVQETMNIIYEPSGKTGVSRFFVVATQTDRRKNTPHEMRILVRAFDCPTQPKIYVHVNDDKGTPIVWTMMKKRGIEKNPDFDIMGFKAVFVKSIQVYQRHSFIRDSQERPNDATVDMDQITENKLRDLCRQAVQILLEKDVEFTNEKVSSEYYVFQMENQSSDKPIPVRAIKCPIKSMVYLHITNRDSVERMVGVIIQRDDVQSSISPFRW